MAIDHNMTKTPKHNISQEKATALLNNGITLKDYYVEGELKIETVDGWNKEIVIENCIIEYFSGSVTQFEKAVSITNSRFKKCQFVFTYFLGGLEIDNCIFDSYLDFQAGGHNKFGNSVLISNNEFYGFVNFFDCWYENEFTAKKNNFLNGTNLLGKPHNIPVTFDIEPNIIDNIGQLNFDHEGIE
ncbi:hypothetical protein [Nonlabens sp. Asnod2-A12]|uniref:hypothetical protein n=1 Tax=Nonlabens sp. Asnod2-A12 TaxID=3160578 RepID=UPI003863A567